MISQLGISWDSLSTTDTFDSGDNNRAEMLESTKLVSGELMQDEPSIVNTPVSLLVQSLIHQLCSMLEKDHDRSIKLYNAICQKLHDVKLLDNTFCMGEFEFIRSQYQLALQHLVRAASGDKLPLVSPSAWPTSVHSWSRYHREFEEIDFIADGGFGKVFQARHRLDGIDYAIKKICMKSSDLQSVFNHLAEVKTLAALDHPNIVSYKSAWLEPLLEKGDSQEQANRSQKEPSTNHSSSSYLSHNQTTNIGNDQHTDESDSQVSFRYSNGDAIDVANNNKITKDSCKALCKVEDGSRQMMLVIKPPQINLKWATLYIQMSLCDKTMKAWLEERNLFRGSLQGPSSMEPSSPTANLDVDMTVDIFNQLAKGLHYIHNKNIIHHDIKPSNIFVGTQGTARNVRLGDFGLACPLQKSHRGIAIGTKLYAAPEQLNGECNFKSDLYSIGLILLEMIESFRTDMEKVERMEELRKGKIPAHITANYPKLAHIISRLVQVKTEKRIDTSELLNLLSELTEDKDETIRSLRDENLSLRRELDTQRDCAREKDDEILRLKKCIESLLNPTTVD